MWLRRGALASAISVVIGSQMLFLTSPAAAQSANQTAAQQNLPTVNCNGTAQKAEARVRARASIGANDRLTCRDGIVTASRQPWPRRSLAGRIGIARSQHQH